MTHEDDFILRTEQETMVRGRHYTYGFQARPFCVRALANAQPSNADAAYAKKQLIGKLKTRYSKLEESPPVECFVAECELRLSRDSLEVLDGACRLAEICLKQAWEARNGDDEEDRQYFDSVADIAGEGPGSYRCPNPFCGFHAGWSEDGIPGTVGVCLSEEAVSADGLAKS